MRVLYGISCRNYEAAAEAIPGAIGLSGSTVSRGFIEASAAKLHELQERDLAAEDVVAIVLDGKTFAEATMVIALGITISGAKHFLGFVETDTENERGLTLFLRSLVERGLDLSQGLLVILDGSKGLRAAVRKTFRHRALVQRCQWHKRENVVSHLAKSELAAWRQRLQRAYNRPEYDEALTALKTLQGELDERNQSAARSLTEGLDETLTLHRLGLYGVLGRSLKTTNCLESVNALVERPHRVPLARRAVEILDAARTRGDGTSPLVFPTVDGTPLPEQALRRLLQDQQIAAVPHGFRSTFRDWAAEDTDHPREVIEAALAHMVHNQVEAAYARSDLFERRRRLMDDWAEYVGG